MKSNFHNYKQELRKFIRKFIISIFEMFYIT